MKKTAYLLSALLLVFFSTVFLARQLASAGALELVTINPSPRSLAAATNAPITLTFNQPVNPATITNLTFWAFGRWS